MTFHAKMVEGALRAINYLHFPGVALRSQSRWRSSLLLRCQSFSSVTYRNLALKEGGIGTNIPYSSGIYSGPFLARLPIRPNKCGLIWHTLVLKYRPNSTQNSYLGPNYCKWTYNPGDLETKGCKIEGL